MGIHEASLGSSKHVSYLHSITSSCGWPDIFPTVLLAPSQRVFRRMRSRSLIINTVKWSTSWWTRLLFQLVVSILCAPMIPGSISDKSSTAALSVFVVFQEHDYQRRQPFAVDSFSSKDFGMGSKTNYVAKAIHIHPADNFLVLITSSHQDSGLCLGSIYRGRSGKFRNPPGFCPPVVHHVGCEYPRLWRRNEQDL